MSKVTKIIEAERVFNGRAVSTVPDTERIQDLWRRWRGLPPYTKTESIQDLAESVGMTVEALQVEMLAYLDTHLNRGVSCGGTLPPSLQEAYHRRKGGTK